MKAVVYRADIGLVVEDVPAPNIEPDQVLIRVANTGFCGSDHTLVESGNLADGYILGHETSGRVEAFGSDVSGVKEGTKVMIRPTACGTCPDCMMEKPYFCQHDRRSIGIGDLPGGFAEYVVVYPEMLIEVPDGVDSRNAALAEAFAASLHGIHCSGATGGSALVIGGGPIGLALVRLLKIMDFRPIALSEPIQGKRELGLDFGADSAINPVDDNLGLLSFQLTGGRMFDTVYECSGVPGQVQTALDMTARGGMTCVVSVISRPAEITPATLTFKEVRLTGSYSNTHQENMRILNWMAEGKLDAGKLVTDSIPLEDLPKVYKERIHTGRAIKVLLEIGEEF